MAVADGEKFTATADETAAEEGAIAPLNSRTTIETLALEDPQAFANAVRARMDAKYPGWDTWPANKKIGTFAEEAHVMKLEAEGHTVFRRAANAGGTDFNTGGIDMISLGPDGRWYLHEIKGTLQDRPSFSSPLQAQLANSKVNVFDDDWVRANLKDYVGVGDTGNTRILTEADIRDMMTTGPANPASHTGSVRSVSVYGDRTVQIGPKNLSTYGEFVDEFEVVPFFGSMRTALGL
jgi:hypothetical protein